MQNYIFCFQLALDDRFHLGVRIKIVFDVVVECCMIFGAGIMLRGLGDIVGVVSIVMLEYGSVFPVNVSRNTN